VNAARRTKRRLEDAIEAVDLALDIVERGRAAYDDEWTLRAALARELEIVGEAIVALPKALTERYPETPWIQARGMRNRLAHDYFDTEAGVLWQTAVEDLPPLLDQLNRILIELEDSEE
jgi:uncharacterized protein with HEPN domain